MAESANIAIAGITLTSPTRPMFELRAVLAGLELRMTNLIRQGKPKVNQQ